MVSLIVFCGRPAVLACDTNCFKAWGINNRPSVQVGDDTDDYAFLADGELGLAPDDPGTYEGDHAKPKTVPPKHNKWCARECERSVVTSDRDVAVPSYDERLYNKPTSDRTGDNS